MRYNIVATRCKSQFQNHVIIRVCEKWSPKKMDFLQMRLAGKIAQIPAGIFGSVAGRQILGACQRVLPLGIKSHRKAKLEFGRWNGTDERETRARVNEVGSPQKRGDVAREDF